MLEGDFDTTVRMDHGRLLPAEDSPGARSEARDDIVDDLVGSAPDGGARVVLLPGDAFVQRGRIAAVLRCWRPS